MSGHSRDLIRTGVPIRGESQSALTVRTATKKAISMPAREPSLGTTQCAAFCYAAARAN